MIDLVIFDLDGTLIDSRLDLANSVNEARAHMGMGALSIELISKYVGRGAPVLMRRALGPEATEEEVAEALAFFLRHYRTHALDTTSLFPGVRESLDRLRAAGKQLAVLTNKPEAISRNILLRLDLSGMFFRVYGGDSFPAKKPDPIGVNRIREESGIAGNRTAMVGDSSVDVETARNAGVRACAVSYGFAPESLSDPQPDLLVAKMPDLADRVLEGAI